MPALLSENPHIDAETYMEALSHLSEIERARLVRGDWSAKDAGTLFSTERIRLVDDAALEEAGWGRQPDGRPARVATVRAWDLAATEESPAAPDPDWTVNWNQATRLSKAGLLNSLPWARRWSGRL
jgi:hypothetical protein